jgi:hypothetical protein
MSKLLKHNNGHDFQTMLNNYFNSVLLDFDNAKEINAIKTAFLKEKEKLKEKNRKQK